MSQPETIEASQTPGAPQAVVRSQDAVVLLSDVLEVFRKRNDIPQDLKPIPAIRAGHGPCCTCQKCGRHYDDCVCGLNELLEELLAIPKQNPSHHDGAAPAPSVDGVVGMKG